MSWEDYKKSHNIKTNQVSQNGNNNTYTSNSSYNNSNLYAKNDSWEKYKRQQEERRKQLVLIQFIKEHKN